MTTANTNQPHAPASRLEHANLIVKDIDATIAFLQTALPDWKVRGRGRSSWHGKARSWAHFGTESSYVTFNDAFGGENRDLAGHSPGLAHLGFVVQDVDAVIGRLQAKGFAIDISGVEHPFRKTVYFLDPSGFQFEFIQYLSNDPAEFNSYELP